MNLFPPQPLTLRIQFIQYISGAVSIATFGLVEMLALGDHEAAYRFGQLALKLLETCNCREMMARTYNPVYGFISAYKDPLRDSIAPLLEAYKLNILTGDVEVGTCCAVCLLRFGSISCPDTHF